MHNHLMVVIHAVSEGQVRRNIRLAFDSGADGVFLINHKIEAERLVGLYLLSRELVGHDKCIGVNFLGAERSRALHLLQEIPQASAIWFDDVGYKDPVGDLVTESTQVVRKIKHRLDFMGFEGDLFGGVAFKYQTQPQDLVLATRLLAPWMDVLTTSGPATGVPPTVEKLAYMRMAVPTSKIAVASGVTPENVEPFLPYVNYFLVNTGLSKILDPDELDRFRVRQMSDKMRRA